MGGLHPKFIEILCNSATDYDVRFFKNSLFASNFLRSNIRFNVWLVLATLCPLIKLEKPEVFLSSKTDWFFSFQLFTFYFNPFSLKSDQQQISPFNINAL